MYTVQLSAIDANLFVVLHAMLEERTVAAAARRVGLSPSAASHALARLRDVVGDPLFVRAGRTLVPTPRALALQPAIAQAILALEGALSTPRPLDAATLARAFRVETTDHLQFVLLAALDRAVRTEAPAVDIYFQSLQPETFARLRRNDIDLAIGVYPTLDPDIERADLLDDRLVAVVRRRHPALRAKMTLARFAAMTHLLVAPNGTPTGLVDQVLARHGLRRRIARTSSTFLDIAFLVAATDDVVSLPESLARPLLDRLGLAVLEVPLQLPRFTLSMVWHRRQTIDPAHRWFREHVARAARPTAKPRRRSRR